MHVFIVIFHRSLPHRLTHQGLVQRYVHQLNKRDSMGWNNVVSPVRCQAIIWARAVFGKLTAGEVCISTGTSPGFICFYRNKQIETRRHDRHFAKAIFRLNLLSKNWCLLIEFSLGLLLRAQLTIRQHWFRQWVGAEQATSHYITVCVYLGVQSSFVDAHMPLRWRHNDHAGVSNHQPHGCLLNRLFRRKSKKTSQLSVTGLCAGNSPGTGEFPAQMASYAENVSIWWRHHGICITWPQWETALSRINLHECWHIIPGQVNLTLRPEQNGIRVADIIKRSFLNEKYLCFVSNFNVDTKGDVDKKNQIACWWLGGNGRQASSRTNAGEILRRHMAPLGHSRFIDACLISPVTNSPWRRHRMETFSALLALWVGNPPVTMDSPHKGQWHRALMFSLISAWTQVEQAIETPMNLGGHYCVIVVSNAFWWEKDTIW